MKFTLRRPCAHCPFRSDIRPFLQRGRAAEIAEAITTRQQTFACHETTVPDEDEDGFGEMRETPNSQHCAGAMILLEKIERPNQMMRIAERLRLYDRSRLAMDSPVFATARAFIEAQED